MNYKIITSGVLLSAVLALSSPTAYASEVTGNFASDGTVSSMTSLTTGNISGTVSSGSQVGGTVGGGSTTGGSTITGTVGGGSGGGGGGSGGSFITGTVGSAPTGFVQIASVGGVIEYDISGASITNGAPRTTSRQLLASVIQSDIPTDASENVELTGAVESAPTTVTQNSEVDGLASAFNIFGIEGIGAWGILLMLLIALILISMYIYKKWKEKQSGNNTKNTL